MFKAISAALLLLSVWACGTEFDRNSNIGNSRPANVSVTNSSPSQNSNSRSSKEETILSWDEYYLEQAKKQAEAYWKRHLIQCGGSYFISEKRGVYTNYYQMKGDPNFNVEGRYYPSKNLTQAEKLNGVDPQPYEWRGKAMVTFSAGRSCNAPGKDQGMWRDDYTIRVNVDSKKGKWEIRYEPYVSLIPIKCADVPCEK
ncbi:MAG: hypothetical protein AB1757_06700 [Acidobacteriota bacterium]